MKLLKIKKIFDYRRFEDTKRVIRRRKWEKYRQYSGEQKKNEDSYTVHQNSIKRQRCPDIGFINRK
jgi:hypothetical protein